MTKVDVERVSWVWKPWRWSFTYDRGEVHGTRHWRKVTALTVGHSFAFRWQTYLGDAS